MTFMGQMQQNFVVLIEKGIMWGIRMMQGGGRSGHPHMTGATKGNWSKEDKLQTQQRGWLVKEAGEEKKGEHPEANEILK